MRVVVAGGTGVVGRYVVEELSALGHTPVVLARGRGVDLLTGTGLDEAMAGAEAAIDVSNVVTMRRSSAVGFFEAATGRLVDSSRRAGVRHLVVLSIVGVDRVGLGYYEAKLCQERIALSGAVPATVLRRPSSTSSRASCSRGSPDRSRCCPANGSGLSQRPRWPRSS